MWLLLHPGFISTKKEKKKKQKQRTTVWSDDGTVRRLQSTDCHRPSSGLDATPVPRYFTGQFVQRSGWRCSRCPWGLPGRAGSLYRSCPISVFTRVVSDS